MLNIFKKNFNLQFFISYLGIFPFIFILLDIHIFNIFIISLLKEFILIYTLLIFTFIGATRWNYVNGLSFFEIFFGFLPSMISAFLIILYLLKFDMNLILSFIIFLLIIQLIVDFVFYKYNFSEKNFFFVVRLPATLIICFNIYYLISV